MVRRINSSRYNKNKSMSEMHNRRMRRNKGMSESRNYPYRKQLRESTHPSDIASDLYSIITDRFNGTTTDDVQIFLDNEFDRIVQEYIDETVKSKSDCFKIIDEGDVFDWYDAKDVIGHIAETIEDLAAYAILLIARESDVYEKAKNYLIDRIENPEDYE